jgi:hypothetical protein
MKIICENCGNIENVGILRIIRGEVVCSKCCLIIFGHSKLAINIYSIILSILIMVIAVLFPYKLIDYGLSKTVSIILTLALCFILFAILYPLGIFLIDKISMKNDKYKINKYYTYFNLSILLIIVVITILIKFLFLQGASKEQEFILSCAYATVSWTFINISFFYRMNQLIKYLKENQYEIWKSMSKGIPNNFRLYRFVFSRDSLNDKCLAHEKYECRKSFGILIIVFVTMPLISIIIFS